MPETTPLIKAALNLRVGAGFDVYQIEPNQSHLIKQMPETRINTGFRHFSPLFKLDKFKDILKYICLSFISFCRYFISVTYILFWLADFLLPICCHKIYIILILEIP